MKFGSLLACQGRGVADWGKLSTFCSRENQTPWAGAAPRILSCRLGARDEPNARPLHLLVVALISDSIMKPLWEKWGMHPLFPFLRPPSEACPAPEFKQLPFKQTYFDTVITGLERCFTLEYKTLIKLKFFHEIMKINSLSKLASTNSRGASAFSQGPGAADGA